jgi:hypothetical protein
MCLDIWNARKDRVHVNNSGCQLLCHIFTILAFFFALLLHMILTENSTGRLTVYIATGALRPLHYFAITWLLYRSRQRFTDMLNWLNVYIHSMI